MRYALTIYADTLQESDERATAIHNLFGEWPSVEVIEIEGKK